MTIHDSKKSAVSRRWTAALLAAAAAGLTGAVTSGTVATTGGADLDTVADELKVLNGTAVKTAPLMGYS